MTTSARPRRLRELATLAAFVTGLLAARSSLADHYQVPTGSMLPTVQIGDRIVVSKLAYGLRVPFTDVTVARFAGPAPGDVVVLRSPEDGTVLLKRVVAGPGDLVEVRDGHVYLDGVRASFDDHHPLRLAAGGGPDFGPVRLGDDEYLVLGDNRGDSRDGRSFGLIRRRVLLGRALGVYARGGRPTWQGL